MRSKPLLAFLILGALILLTWTSTGSILPVGLESPYVVEVDLSGSGLVVDPRPGAEKEGYVSWGTSLIDPASGEEVSYITVLSFSDPISSNSLSPVLRASMEVNSVGVRIEASDGGHIGTGLLARRALTSWGAIYPIEAEGEGVGSFGMVVAGSRDEELNERLAKSARFGLRSELRQQHPGSPMVVTEGSIRGDIAVHERMAVNFWSERCSYCRRLAPVLDELAVEYQGRVFFGMANMEENPRLWDEYEIKAVPTVILFRNGTEVERVTGLIPKPDLEVLIDGHL
jgi:thioredoxin 1